MKENKDITSDEKILETAVKRYHDCETPCSEIYRDALADIEFSAGEQWEGDMVKDREGRPCLVENRLSGMIHQVCNEQRQNRPMMRVTPVDDTTDPTTAEVINGLLRHIQYSSSSETAVDTAFDNAVRGGIGWYRVLTDYIDDQSFEQQILIKRIEDIASVKIPFHLCHEIDCSDMPYAFIESRISKDEFEAQFPDAEEENWQNMLSSGDGWITNDGVRICEYLTIDKKPKKLYKLISGEIVDVVSEGEIAISERDTFERVINWYKITATQVLSKNKIPGKWIPLIPVIGEEIFVKGKRQFHSLTRNARDPQKMLNYWRSAETERIALAPKQKFIVAANQIENYEQEWSLANKSNDPVLHYNPIIEGGTLVPPPHQLAPTQIDMAIVNAAKESIDAIKATTGIFDASMGATSNERSGKAILARQREGDTSNYHFFDNAAKSMRHCCRVIVDMIPEVIDTARAIRILGDDMKPKIAQVNQTSDNGKIYDLTTGRYDVMVETGPSYASKQQETIQNIRDLSQSDPNVIAATRDLLAKFLQMPTEIVERFRKTIDPNLLASDKEEDPQMLKAQIAQYQQQLQQLDQVIQKMDEELTQSKSVVVAKSMDNGTKLKIAELESTVKILLQRMNNSHEVGIESMRNVHNMVASSIEPTTQQNDTVQSPATNAESMEQFL
jgi:predicted NBD/HSP70 family sugar kinase